MSWVKCFCVVPLLAAAATLVLPGCDNAKAKQQAAVENFNRETRAFHEWGSAKRKAWTGDRKAGIALTREMLAKMKAMKTDDLPQDYKEAFRDFVSKFEKVEPVFAEIESDDGVKKAASDPMFNQQIAERLNKIMSETKNAGEWMDIVGRKYGIEKSVPVN